MSVGDLKYTTFSFNELITKKVIRIAEVNTRIIKKARILTFLPYMKI
tara:strand:+ start:29 stop:169 length:141 start_codon:yes stop_codon:yes gene_type:complete